MRRFRSDRVATVEAGFRAGRPNRDSVDLSVTVARTAWHDIQADFLDGAGLPSTANIGNGRLWTLEAHVGAQVVGGLRLEGAASYNDSQIDDPSRALVQAFAAVPVTDFDVERAQILARLRQIPNIARVTARAGAIYQHQLSDAADLRIDGWLRYVGPPRLGIGPVLGRSQGSYLDSGITARIGFSGFDVTASVPNLTDTRGNRFALGTPFTTGRDQVTPLRPRTIRLGLDAVF